MRAELGKVFRHYKGNKYFVIALATHSETKEDLVVYRPYVPNFGGTVEDVWARPRKMFEEKAVIDGKEIDRFEAVNS